MNIAPTTSSSDSVDIIQKFMAELAKPPEEQDSNSKPPPVLPDLNFAISTQTTALPVSESSWFYGREIIEIDSHLFGQELLARAAAKRSNTPPLDVPEGIRIEVIPSFGSLLQVDASTGQIVPAQNFLTNLLEKQLPLFRDFPPLLHERFLSALQSSIFKICYFLFKEKAFATDKKELKELYQLQRQLFSAFYSLFLFAKDQRDLTDEVVNPLQLFKLILLVDYVQARSHEMITSLTKKMEGKASITAAQKEVYRRYLQHLQKLYEPLLEIVNTQNFYNFGLDFLYLLFKKTTYTTYSTSFNPPSKKAFFLEQIKSKIMQLQWEFETLPDNKEAKELQSMLSSVLGALQAKDFIKVNALLYQFQSCAVVQNFLGGRTTGEESVKKWSVGSMSFPLKLSYNKLTRELKEKKLEKLPELIAALKASKNAHNLLNESAESTGKQVGLELSIFELVHLLSVYKALAELAPEEYRFINFEHGDGCLANLTPLSRGLATPPPATAILENYVDKSTRDRLAQAITQLQDAISSFTTEHEGKIKDFLTTLQKKTVDATLLGSLSTEMHRSIRPLFLRRLKSLRKALDKTQQSIAISLIDEKNGSVKEIQKKLIVINAWLEKAFGPMVDFLNNFSHLILSPAMQPAETKTAPLFTLFLFETGTEVLLGPRKSLQKALDSSTESIAPSNDTATAAVVDSDEKKDREDNVLSEDTESPVVLSDEEQTIVQEWSSSAKASLPSATAVDSLKKTTYQQMQQQLNEIFEGKNSKEIMKEVVRFLKAYSIWFMLVPGGRHPKIYIGNSGVPIPFPTAREWKKGTQEGIKKSILSVLGE